MFQARIDIYIYEGLIIRLTLHKYMITFTKYILLYYYKSDSLSHENSVVSLEK